ncbi:MAG: glycosyltransferase family 4 protein [Chloroflexi bacterium]|nr:glycosyltransferase family 4 protein [Chloroflexota bacterium]
MKILHVVHGYPPSSGGSQWLVKKISEQLVSRYGDEVTVFSTVAYNMAYFWGEDSLALPEGQEKINGVTVQRFPVFNKLNRTRRILAGAATRLKLPYNDWLRTFQTGPIIPGMTQAVAHSRADVVMATAFPLMHMYYALSGAKKGNIPIVFVGAIHPADRWGYDRKMIYRAIQQVDAYMAQTQFEKAFLTARGIDPHKIFLLGGGIDRNIFIQADGSLLRKEYGWEESPVILMLSKHVARKRFDTLLQALPLVWAKFPNARLVLAGHKTAYSETIRSRVEQLAPQEQAKVSLIYNLTETKKADLLAACDIFVLPSGEEAFGIVFAEAWACGKPVIGADVGAIASLIDVGRDGLLFEYGNAGSLAEAILVLLVDEAKRRRMGAAGREKVLASSYRRRSSSSSMAI